MEIEERRYFAKTTGLTVNERFPRPWQIIVKDHVFCAADKNGLAVARCSGQAVAEAIVDAVNAR